MECLPPEVTEPRQPVSNYLCYVPFIVPNSFALCYFHIFIPLLFLHVPFTHCCKGNICFVSIILNHTAILINVLHLE